MSSSDKAKDVQNLIIKHAQNFDGASLAPSRDMLTGIGSVLETLEITEEMAAANPELAQGLDEQLQALAQMQVLIDQVQSAQDAGDTDAMLALSQAAAELSGIDMTPEVLPAPFDALQDAIEEGDVDSVCEVLKSKPDLNQLIGKYQSTPLIWAMTSEDRSPEMLAVLVDAGADVRFSTPEGYTPLHSVGDYMHRYETSVEDDYAVAAYLVAQGADLAARNHYGWTPLDRAVIEGVPEEVNALLRAGADPNLGRVTIPTLGFDTGYTPLANAVSEPEKVRLLLEFGADPAAKSTHGITALDEIERLLIDEGDDDSYPEFYDNLRASRALINQKTKLS